MMLAAAARRLAEAGWGITNIDCTVICDEPKISSNRAEMQRNLAGAAGAPVSVKGKRTEGIDGLGGGIQCHATAMIHRPTEGVAS
jgi:2-C-methyl-D-erythritol 2,4-cyclodiphosphate synthase